MGYPSGKFVEMSNTPVRSGSTKRLARVWQVEQAIIACRVCLLQKSRPVVVFPNVRVEQVVLLSVELLKVSVQRPVAAILQLINRYIAAAIWA